MGRVAAAVALITLTACGAPAGVERYNGEPDLVRIGQGTIPHGFASSANEELRRLRDACSAIDAEVGTRLPDVTRLGLVDGPCQWLATSGNPPPGVPELIVGILASPAGGVLLDQTTTVLKDGRSVAGIGDRAVFDLQTRTMYVVKNSRLWYLQLVGTAPGGAAETILASLGRALVQTRAAVR